MFTCPKCKTIWNYNAQWCTCGERIAYYSSDLSQIIDEVYLEGGYPAVEHYLKNLQKKQKEESDKKFNLSKEKLINDERQKEEERIRDERQKEEERVRGEKFEVISRALTPLVLASFIFFVIGFLLYIFTPNAIRFIEIISGCLLDPTEWGFFEYINFWWDFCKYFLGLILSLLFFIAFIFQYEKEKSENPKSSKGWMVTGAVAGALLSKKIASGAVKGAAVGFVAHKSMGLFWAVVVACISAIPLYFWEKSFKENYCVSNINSKKISEKNSKSVAVLDEHSLNKKNSHSQITIPVESVDKTNINRLKKNFDLQKFPPYFNAYLIANEEFSDYDEIKIFIQDDFNGDGLIDYVYEVNNYINCGARACATNVLVSNGKKYISVFEGLGLGAVMEVFQDSDGTKGIYFRGNGDWCKSGLSDPCMVKLYLENNAMIRR